jgi:hypothetical protein
LWLLSPQIYQLEADSIDPNVVWYRLDLGPLEQKSIIYRASAAGD